MSTTRVISTTIGNTKDLIENTTNNLLKNISIHKQNYKKTISVLLDKSTTTPIRKRKQRLSVSQ